MKQLRRNEPGGVGALVMEVAHVRVRDAGVEFLWNKRVAEWSEIELRLIAQGRAENYVVRGVVVDCRPAVEGLWQVSLFFTDVERGEKAWPPA